jgi:hypothetical protein
LVLKANKDLKEFKVQWVQWVLKVFRAHQVNAIVPVFMKNQKLHANVVEIMQ